MPITGVPSTTPSATGCAGRSATPCATSSPWRSSTAAVWSARPREEPAITSTRSLVAAARTTAAPIASASSGRDGRRSQQRARIARQRLQHRPVGIGDLAGQKRRARRAQLAARRQDRDAGPHGDGQLGMTGDGRERDVVAREQAAGRQERVALAHVLTGGADVRAGLDVPARPAGPRRSRRRSRAGRRRRSGRRAAVPCRSAGTSPARRRRRAVSRATTA